MIRLSEKERELLSVLQTEAAMSVSEAAERSGLAPHSVRYHLGALLERGVIGHPLPFINVYRLGYTEFVIYLSLSSEGQKRREEFLSALAVERSVSWLLHLGGQYQYAISICASHVQEVADLLHGFCEKFGNVFAEKEINLRLAFTYYGRRYLAEVGRNAARLHVGGAGTIVEVDEIDRKVLSAMAHGEFKSISHISRITGIPNTTLERRKRRLEELKVIDGYTYQLRASDIGVQQYKLLVQVRGINPRLTEQLRALCESQRNVVFFVECIGSWDYEFGIEAETASTVSELSDLIHRQFPQEIISINMLPVIAYLKRHSYPFYEN